MKNGSPFDNKVPDCVCSLHLFGCGRLTHHDSLMSAIRGKDIYRYDMFNDCLSCRITQENYSDAEPSTAYKYIAAKRIPDLKIVPDWCALVLARYDNWYF